jgi:DNA primase
MIFRERIEKLKAAISVPEYFRYAGCGIRGSGSNFPILCPFRKEKTPSLHLYKDHYHCYGCGEHGDIIDAHMKLNKLTFIKALEDLCRLAGINQSPEFRGPGGNSRTTNSRV